MDIGNSRAVNQRMALMALATGLGWISVVGALGAVVASIATGRILVTDIYNADTFQVATLWRDLGRQGSLAGWDLPVNPPLFPDGLLFGPLWLLIPNLYVTNVVYGVGQVLLFLIGLTGLFRQLFGQPQRAVQWLLLAATIFLLLLASGRHYALTFIFLPVHHFGVVLVLPLLLMLLLQRLSAAARQDQAVGDKIVNLAARLGPEIVLVSVTLLSAFTDSLFVVQITIPLVSTLAIFAVVQPDWRQMSLRLGGLLIIMSGIGQLGRLLILESAKLNNYYQPVTQAQAWQALRQWLTSTLHQEPLFSAYWLTALGALVLLLILLGFDLRRSTVPSSGDTNSPVGLPPLAVNTAGLILVVTDLLLTAGLSTLAPLLAGNFFSEKHTRYLIPPIYLPLFLGWPLLLAYWPLRPSLPPAMNDRPMNRFTRHRAMLATAGLSLLFATFIFYHTLTLKFSALAQLPAWQDATARCLAEAVEKIGLRKGMAHFWQANYLPLLAQEVNLVQVHPDLTIYYYNNNLHWYDEAIDYALIDTGAEPDYRLDQDKIINQFGPPAQTLRCGQSSVLVYNRPSDLPFQRQLQTQPVRARFDQPGDSFTFYGSSLPSLIGGLGIGLSKAVSEQWGNRSGELGIIHLQQLPAATYSFAIHAFADSANTGAWTVSAQEGTQRTILAQGQLTARGRQVLQGSFTLATANDVVLTVLYQQGTLYLDKVELQRAGAVAVTTPTPTDPDQLTLIYPWPGSFLVHPQADFVWQWTGAPLTPEQAFEVRIWHEADPYHYGAHDAAASRADLRQIDDTYTLHLDLGGVYSLQQQGQGEYSWSVAVVNVEPRYQDLQIEALPSIFFWEPE